LKRGFKEVFGSTVFDYLRDRRMEKARQLLLDGQLKVATVARVVGYHSPTSFNAAFKQSYGVSPKAYQLSMRK
ncbi:MAG: helix-turn-helix transcriptional regulator, partial [Cyanobacteria bacterium P01_D01_bin.115]